MANETPTAQEQKAVLRRSVLPLRRRAAADTAGVRAIAERLLQRPEWQSARTVLAYLALPTEISMDTVIGAALAAGKTVAVPVLTKTRGVMQAVRLAELTAVTEGRLGIREPRDRSAVIAPQSIDLVLVPGTAFSRDGARLGAGGGYYDRYLPQTQAFRVGVAAECMLTNDVPLTDTDARMDAVVTEAAWYTPREGAERRK